LEGVLQEWAGERQWLLEVRGAGEISGWEQTPGLQAVVELGSGLTGDELSSAAPGAAIVTIDNMDAQPGGLMSTVGGQSIRHEQAGFLAGALTGLASEVWRVGAISGGGANDAVYLAAFEHGLKYACPRCWPEYLSALQATVEELQTRRVDAVFTAPGVTQLPGNFQAAIVWVVFVGDVPASVAATQVAGGIIFDYKPLVILALESLLNGGSGTSWPYAVESGSMLWDSLNSEAISPARIRILDEVWEILASGELEVGVDPITGAER
jgi:hypothetical protein